MEANYQDNNQNHVYSVVCLFNLTAMGKQACLIIHLFSNSHFKYTHTHTNIHWIKYKNSYNHNKCKLILGYIWYLCILNGLFNDLFNGILLYAIKPTLLLKSKTKLEYLCHPKLKETKCKLKKRLKFACIHL